MPSEPICLMYGGPTPAGVSTYELVAADSHFADYFAFPADDPDTPARLAGPEAVALLREREWYTTSPFTQMRVCLYCGGIDPMHGDRHGTGHREDCRLAALLARARGEAPTTKDIPATEEG